jgi:hypothetical protein
MRRDACENVKVEKWTLETASEIMHWIVFRTGCCRGSYVNTELMEEFESHGVPEAAIRVYQKYCQDTFDIKRPLGLKGNLRERSNWMRTEVFCEMTRYIAYPDTWLNVFRPEDVPSLEKLEEQAVLLCTQLRNGDITYDDAIFRWEQEMLWFEKHAGPEMMKHSGRELVDGVKSVLDFFKDLVK